MSLTYDSCYSDREYLEGISRTITTLILSFYNILFYLNEFLIPYILEDHIHLDTDIFEDSFCFIYTNQGYKSFFLVFIFSESFSESTLVSFIVENIISYLECSTE